MIKKTVPRRASVLQAVGLLSLMFTLASCLAPERPAASKPVASDLATSTQAIQIEGERFVLVHGAFWGAWVWDDVATWLTQHGAVVSQVELPGHGADTTPIAEVTLQSYMDRIGAAVDASPVPVHLIGHSAGGFWISQYAELAPEKLASLTYMSAYVPPDGWMPLSVFGSDPASELTQYATINWEAGTLDAPMSPSVLSVFCGDCNKWTLMPLVSGYRPEPLVPGLVPMHLTPERYGAVPKRYLFANRDVTISYGYQQTMASAVTMECTRELQTSHFPQLSRPAETATALAMLARCTTGP